MLKQSSKKQLLTSGLGNFVFKKKSEKERISSMISNCRNGRASETLPDERGKEQF